MFVDLTGSPPQSAEKNVVIDLSKCASEPRDKPANRRRPAEPAERENNSFVIHADNAKEISFSVYMKPQAQADRVLNPEFPKQGEHYWKDRSTNKRAYFMKDARRLIRTGPLSGPLELTTTFYHKRTAKNAGRSSIRHTGPTSATSLESFVVGAVRDVFLSTKDKGQISRTVTEKRVCETNDDERVVVKLRKLEED